VIPDTDGSAHHVRLRGIEAFVDAPPAGGIAEVRQFRGPDDPRPTPATAMRSPMVLRRLMRSPMKAAARTAMSTGFSFVPARRRSREAQGALERAADGVDVGNGGCSAGWLRRHAGEGIYKHRKPSVPVGRVARLPWRARGRAQMAEALGVSMMSAALNARAA
jgi:hypothetical protein